MAQLLHPKIPKTFKGLWIPRYILETKEFPAIRKIILAEILALQGSLGFWGSNRHLSRVTGIGPRMIRKHLTALEDAGHLVADDRDSIKRRLWVSDAIVDAVNREVSPAEKEPDTTTGQQASEKAAAGPSATGKANSASSEKRTISTAQTRKSAPSQPGTDLADLESKCLETGNCASTENIERGHQEKTISEKTIHGDDSSFSPDTHLLGSDGSPMVTRALWSEWMERYAKSAPSYPMDEVEQIEELERMIVEGINPTVLLETCIQWRRDTFWEQVPSFLVPRKT